MTADEGRAETEGREAAERYYRHAGWAQACFGLFGLVLLGEAVLGFILGGLFGWISGLIGLAGFVVALHALLTSWWLQPFEWEGWTFYDADHEHHVQQFTERAAQKIIDDAREESE